MDKTRFIKIRKDLGFTQATLADALNVSPGYIGDIERGHRGLSLKLAMRLETVTKHPFVSEYMATKTGQAA